MSGSLFSEFPWACEIVLPYYAFTSSQQKGRPNIKHLQDLVSKTIRLINKRTVVNKNVENCTNCIDFLEKLIYKLNEIHVSSKKVILHFDEETLPLIEKYLKLLQHYAKMADAQTESMKRITTFLSGLPIHQTLRLSQARRTEATLIKLLSKIESEEESEESDFIDSSEKPCEESEESDFIDSSEKPCEESILENKDQQKLDTNGTIECHKNGKEKDKDTTIELDSNGTIGCHKNGKGNDSDTTVELVTNETVKCHKNGKGNDSDTTVELVTNETIKCHKNGKDQVNASDDKEVITANVIEDELNVIPESPMKNSQPTCVGSASIRGILPLSPGFLFPLTPPHAELKETAEKPPTRVANLIELQKTLRQRFQIPHAVTPTERKLRRTILRTIRSKRQFTQQSPWKIIHVNSPVQHRDLARQLFLENGSTPTSSFTLCLSPDTSLSCSSKNEPLPVELVQENEKFPQVIGSANIIEEKLVSPKAVAGSQSPLLEKMKTTANENTYSELKKSIEGNLLGCEASPSDVELMDEIESSLNLEEDDGPYLEPVVYIDQTMATILPPVVEKESSSVKTKTQRVRVSQEQMERRRSSRLAGIPTLPLKYTSEPLPDCRRMSSKKRSPSRKENNIQATSPKKHQSEPPVQLPVSWKEVCLLLPSCWANILEEHVKTHHPDEMLRFRDIPGGRCPIVYCKCTPNKLSESV